MLAELVGHVIGIDPDRDWITAAIVDARTTGVIAIERFAANSDGYNEAFDWADDHTEARERAWAVEGTASYGRGLTAALTRSGEWVIELDRPHQRTTKDDGTLDDHHWIVATGDKDVVAAAAYFAPEPFSDRSGTSTSSLPRPISMAHRRHVQSGRLRATTSVLRPTRLRRRSAHPRLPWTR